MNIPPSFRPTFNLKNGHWHRETPLIELKDCFIIWDGLFYAVEDLKKVVGVQVYGCYISDNYYVFDFSASHLCPNQLQRIKEYIHAKA